MMAADTRSVRLTGITCAALVLGLMLAGAAPAQEAAPLAKAAEDILPAGTMAVVSFPDLGATRSRAVESALYKIWSDPGVQEFLKPVIDKVNTSRAEIEGKLQKETGFTLADLKKLANGHLTIALINVQLAEQPQPQGVIILAPRDSEHLKRCVSLALAQAPEAARQQMSKRQIAGVEVTDLTGGPTRVSWGFVGGAMVVALGPGTIEDIIPAMLGDVPGRLKDSATFQAVVKRLGDTRQEYLGYVNLEQVMSVAQVAAMAASPQVGKAIEAIGLADIKAIGQAAAFRGAALEDRAFVYMGGGQGRLANLLRPEPVNRQLLENVPAEAIQVQLSRINLSLLVENAFAVFQEVAPQKYEEFRKQMATFEQQLGFNIEKDLIKGLGKEILVYRVPTNGAAPPAPVAGGGPRMRMMGQMLGIQRRAVQGVTYLITVQNPAKVRESLKKLTDYAVMMASAKAAGGAGGNAGHPQIRFEERSHGDVTIRSLAGLPPMVPFSPSYCVTDRFLVLAFDDGAVERGVNQTWKPQRSFLGSQIMADAGPHMLPGCASVGIADLRTQAAEGVGMVFTMLRAMPQGSEIPPVFRELFAKDPKPLVEAAKRHLFTSVNCVKGEPDGLVLTGYSPFGGSPTVMVAGGAIGAGMLLPALARAREQARRTVDMSNLRQIGMAIMMYLNQRGKMPESLQELVELQQLTADVLKSPRDKTPAGGAVPISFRYVGPLPEKIMSPNTIIAYDKPGLSPKGRNALFFDMHVEWIDARQFRGRLARSLNEVKAAAAKAGAKLDEARMGAFYNDRDWRPAPAATGR